MASLGLRCSRAYDAVEHDHADRGVQIARMRPGIVMQREAGSALLRYGLPSYVRPGFCGRCPSVPSTGG